MEQAEKSREQNSGRPEGHARGQREKCITTKEEFLEKSDNEKGYPPQNGVLEQLEAMQPNGPEAENAGQPHTNQQGGNSQEANYNPLPELAPKRPAQRQSVVCNSAAFDSRHYPTGEQNNDKGYQLIPEQGARFK